MAMDNNNLNNRDAAENSRSQASVPGELDDLEQYGVWVKAGPEDVNDQEADQSFEMSDLSEDVDTQSLSGESDLTDEEEDLLSTLEDEREAESDFQDEELPDFSPEDTAIDLEGEDLLIDMDEPDEETENIPAGGNRDLSEELALDEDISIDSEDTDFLSLDTDRGLEELETPISSEMSPQDETDSEELLDLDSLDTFNEEEEDESITADDLEEEDLQAIMADEALDTIPGGSGGVEDFSFEEEESEEELPELDSEEEGDAELEDTSGLESFDDLSAVEEELSSPSTGQPAEDDSPAILHSIEHELAAIKTELNDLRQELATLRSAPSASQPSQPPAGQQPAPGVEPEEAEPLLPEEGEDGFFTEDEDETIALTGDELDNILNTAEFTEETGRPTEYDDLDLSADFDTSDVLGESLSGGGREEDLISMEEEPEEEALTEFDATDAEEEPAELLETVDELEEDTEIELPEPGTGFEEESSAAAPIEEITLEEIEEENAPGSDEEESEELTLDLDSDAEEIDIPSTGDEVFSGDDSEIDALAEMDIDSELADIDELKDEPEEDFSAEAEDLSDLELEMEQEPVSVSEEEVQSLYEEDTEGETAAGEAEHSDLPEDLRSEIRTVLTYMDQLLEALPEEKIQEFAQSEYFDVYRKLFEDLGLEH